MKRPNSRRNLDAAILRAFGTEREALHARNLMANAIVGQMLPGGVIKGGSALSLRFGDAGTRFTSDLDAARAEALDEFVRRLDESLKEGWEGFTGRVVALEPAHPKDVPEHYVMQPFDVKLSYNGKSFNIPAEVKHWHGAAPDSWFSHLAIEVPGEAANNEWCEPVTDEEYDRLR